MTAADWLAVYAGAPTFIIAVTGLVIAIRSSGKSAATQALLAAHVTAGDHDVRPTGDM